MRDELDILREKAELVNQLQDRLNKTQKKLENLSDLKNQIKVKFFMIK